MQDMRDAVKQGLVDYGGGDPFQKSWQKCVSAPQTISMLDHCELNGIFVFMSNKRVTTEMVTISKLAVVAGWISELQC